MDQWYRVPGLKMLMNTLYGKHPQWILIEKALLEGLERGKGPKMMRTSHEEHDTEDSKAKFTWLKKIIATFIEMVAQPLVMKD